MNPPSSPHRATRSFVRRAGRITSAQRRALADIWPRYGIESGDTPLDLAALFQRTAPLIVEIGFGNGEALAAMAVAHPENNYLGIEVHRPGIGSLLLRLESSALTNVRLLEGDAKEILGQCVPPGSVQGVHLFFPDPWPKKRHHKRRLVQTDFIELIRRALIPGGYFHLATDWQDYAEHMLALLSQTPGLENSAGSSRNDTALKRLHPLSPRGRGVGERGRAGKTPITPSPQPSPLKGEGAVRYAPSTFIPQVVASGTDGFAPRPDYRPLTKFERRGQKLGHGVWDLIFRRVD
jgi:tRNA (guanine-N7-)-methyltransferase